MNRKLDLSKGQKVFVKIEDGSNASRRFRTNGGMNFNNIDDWVFEGEVISKGRKYITVKYGRSEDKFEIESDYKQHYTAGGADYKLYISKQEILDEFESEDLYSDIKSEFNSWKNVNKFTLEQLREIKDIIKTRNEDDL